jgi:hypothetical protein
MLAIIFGTFMAFVIIMAALILWQGHKIRKELEEEGFFD